MNGMTATVSEAPDSMRAYRSAKTSAVTTTAAVASGRADRRSPRSPARPPGGRRSPGRAAAPSSSGVGSDSIRASRARCTAGRCACGVRQPVWPRGPVIAEALSGQRCGAQRAGGSSLTLSRPIMSRPLAPHRIRGLRCALFGSPGDSRNSPDQQGWKEHARMQDRSPSRRTVIASAAVVAASATGVVGATATPAAAHRRDRRLKKILSGMSTEAKVGQLFVPYFYGSSATSPSQFDQERNLSELGVRTVAELIAKYHLGGVIYFQGWTNNIHDPRQIADLTNGIQRASLALPTPVPSLISIDQEHGANVRVGDGATQLPGAMALGAGRSLSDARTAGRISGTELAALGIHQNFA